MGSVSLKIGDGTARFRRATLCSSAVNLLMLLSVVTTNLFALYAFTRHAHPHPHPKNLSLISEKVATILREIESSQKKLAQMEKQLLGYESIDLSRAHIAGELKRFLTPHPLPLGKDSRTGITEMASSVGHSCEKSIDSLSRFMSYTVNGPCPDGDWILGQKLILSGCEPLPRRRCFAQTNPKSGSNPFPLSLWKDIKPRGKNDFLVDDVLAMGSSGVRLGFDVGGGPGNFAARMAERNVTVVTATLNVDGPFSEFIAARGLFPLYISLDHRFPFYDNVFDVVRVANGLDVGGRAEKLEFLMFDLDRVLRAGGLFWLDNFYCSSDDKKSAVTRLIERFGYKKLKWVVGERVNGSGKSKVYLSAVLQKPARV